jgi:hypothetical protein
MVLRHYGVPTRLLDWSMSPYIAAYFAVCGNDAKDGEIWTFDYPEYEKKGKQQWKECPETTVDGSGNDDKFDAKLTAFAAAEPYDWFICGFYEPGFPRQNAQNGVYTLTARFGREHGDKIASLLSNRSRYHVYVIPATLKRALRNMLREKHGIWTGSLFPDSAGAANTARTVFPHEDV